MLIWILSDVHTEVKSYKPMVPEADVCIAAGDIARGGYRHVEWLQNEIASHMQVVSVLGNHEFYGSSIVRESALAADASSRPDSNVSVLQDALTVIGGVRFVGATLWTDYDLYAAGDEHLRHEAMAKAQSGLNDHRLISLRDFSSEKFTPGQARALHQQSVAYIESVLATPFEGETVVVTHHCPSPKSVAPGFAGDALTPAFASDLTNLIEKYQPALWVHGHTHSSFDYRIGKTRICCNPRGYGIENWYKFDPQLIVEIG